MSKKELNKFFNWAYNKRADSVKKLYKGEMPTKEEMFLSFMSHNPTFISNGSAGLNGSVKGVGFGLKEEYLEEALKDYVEHIKSYKKEEMMQYAQRGLGVLIKHLYNDDALDKIDFSVLYGIELAYKNSYKNYLEDNRATLVFYQPPYTSYELRGRIYLLGEKHKRDEEVDPYSLPLIQQFINAQHDVYHLPHTEVWKERLVYKFVIEEIWDKSATPDGYGKRIK